MSISVLLDILLNAPAEACRGIHTRERFHLGQELLHQILLNIDLLVIFFQARQIRIENGRRAPAERVGEIKVVVLKAANKLIPREALHIFFQLARIIPEFAAVQYLGGQRHEHAAELFRYNAVLFVLRRIAPFYQLREKFFIRAVKPVFICRIAALGLFGLFDFLGLELYLFFLFI